MKNSEPLDKATRQTRRRYDRASWSYDLMERLIEKRAFGSWRQQLWVQVDGRRILEVGVGTGKNFPCYPAEAKVTAIDLSPGMLRVAQTKVHQSKADLELREMDVQNLQLDGASFDAAVATFVFCSVPYPVTGLKEIRRVLEPDGRLYQSSSANVGAPSTPQTDIWAGQLVHTRTGVA